MGWTRPKKVWALAALLLAGLAARPAYRSLRPWLTGDPLLEAPRLMVWAWERTEDLRFLDVKQTGVALLAATLFLEGDSVRTEVRRQPLQLPPYAYLMVVVRLESRTPTLSDTQIQKVELEVLRIGVSKRISAVQLDFDAKQSEREFYRKLIERLKVRLRKFSITALASWCLYDPWISTLDIDEAVPMLFRMGREGPTVRRLLSEGVDFQQKPCRWSAGFSTDEPLAPIPPGRRLYLFTPHSWTPSLYADVLWKLRDLR